ncbi:MAG: stage II sporulation protein M [Caulobacteraceae bacterium]|nr:stage II sporulation protein M [Caulobacteraceae bacterium]
MAELKLKSQRFREQREADWRRLEQLMDKVEKGSARALTDDELLAVPVLYRAALSSLSVARATSLDQGLVAYLETLTARAYFFVYGARSTLGSRFVQFLVQDWPAAVRALWKETLASLAVTVMGTVAAVLLIIQDTDWFYSFLDPDLAQGRDPSASTEALRKGLYDAPEGGGLSFFATYLFTHNAQVALMSFALGFAFGVPTAVLIAMNGAMLGAFLALYFSHGLGWQLVGWLSIHGVTEMFAIILAGAAGFRIGWAAAFPGDLDRLAAATAAGRTAATVMGGVVIMLLAAGLLEGFGRQLITSDVARYAVAGATALFWGLYYYGPRPRGVLDVG